MDRPGFEPGTSRALGAGAAPAMRGGRSSAELPAPQSDSLNPGARFKPYYSLPSSLSLLLSLSTFPWTASSTPGELFVPSTSSLRSL